MPRPTAMLCPEAGASLRVLLVDDHAVVRAGYRALLESAARPMSIVEADSGESAYRAFTGTPFDVVLLDLTLPGISGLETLRRIRAREPAARVLVFSIHDEADFAEHALACGALGYVTKSSAAEVLRRAVETVAAGRRYLSGDIGEALSRQRAGPAAPLTGLGPREFEVFRLLAAGRCVPEIAELLCLSTKTVANYNTRIRAKLGVNGSAELARLAIRHRVLEP